MYVGRAVIATGMLVGQSKVIEAHQVRDCRVKFVNVKRFDSRTCQP